MIEKVFIVPHTHTDLGFTADVAAVVAWHCKLLSSLLDLDWTRDDYRWTIESAVILRAWWAGASSTDRDRAVALLRSGQWQLAGFETQLLTDLASPLELKASVSWACGMGQEHGFPVRGIMLNDLGGCARGLPSAVVSEGIEYFVAGVGGYRVLLPLAELPPLFHWEAPDGARLLFWHLGISEELDPGMWDGLPAQYGFGNSYVIFPTRDHFSDQEYDDDPEKLKFAVGTIDEAYRRLEKDLYRRGYPYRYLMLQASGDNRGLDPDFPRWVSLWNQHVDSPKICGATADEFFTAMREEYGDDFPVLKGALNDPCSDIAVTTPGLFAKYRRNGRTIQTLKALGNGAAAIEQTLSDALRWQQWYSDHTFGLSMWNDEKALSMKLDESAVSDPGLQRWVDSWEDNARYPEKASEILEAGKALLQSGEGVTVFVPSKQPANVIVRLPGGCRAAAHDEAAVQDGTDCTWIEWRDLSLDRPGHVLPAPADAATGTPAKAAAALDSESWRIRFDPDTGQLIEAASRTGPGNVLADNQDADLGDLLVFDVDDLDENQTFGSMRHPPSLRRQPTDWIGCESSADGDLVKEITRIGVIRCPQGDQRLEQRWRLYRASDILEIDTVWDKKPRVRREACYFSVPLSFADPDVLIDQGLTTARVGCEELAGSFRDSYCVQHWLAVKDETTALLITPLEAGLVGVDGIHLLRFIKEPMVPETGSLFFLLSHNCWPTNTPRWQEGRLRFRFRLKLLPANVSSEELSRRGTAMALGALVVGCEAESMAW